MNFNDVISVYDKWLHIEDRDYIPVIYATILANRFDDTPVWLLIIGKSSSGKTVVIQNLEGCEEIYIISSITANSLISAWKEKGDEDKSLIPKLDKKVLLIKDLSTIRTMYSEQKSMVLSQLRDAYDGECGRATGLGVKKYKSKFGLIACATPDYERQKIAESMLGERFLTFKLQTPNFNKTIDKMVSSIGKKSQMEKEIRDSANKFLSSVFIKSIHKIKKTTLNNITKLSEILTTLRSPVSRDGYRRNIDFPVESVEYPIRVSKNLICLYRALLELIPQEGCISIIKRIVKDSVPYERLKVMNCIKEGKNSYVDIKNHVKISDRTMSEILEEMTLLDILSKDVKGNYDINLQYNLLYEE